MRRLSVRLALGSLTLLTGALVLSAAPAAAQTRVSTFPRQSPSASVSQTFGVTTATVTYGRPALKGRPIFSAADGDLAPAGGVWRTGADEASTITFTTGVSVEGRPLAAGTYGLFTIPGAARWTVVFNRVPAQWGAFQYDATQDALRVDVAPTTGTPAMERFTILFDAVTDTTARMVLAWGETRVPVSFSARTPALIRAAGDAAAADATDWRVPFRYASFALSGGSMTSEGRTWAARAVALDPNYSTLRLSALYAAAANDYRTAVETGERALALARAQATPPQGLAEFEGRLTTWRAQR